MTTRSSQQIAENIARAWAEVPYPGDDHIFIPDSYDDEGITEYFAGTSWRGHSAAALRARCSAISVFFTPEAYRYWLPAYLFAVLEEPDELSQGVDALLSSLAPDSDSMWSRSRQLTKLGLLSSDQIELVREVIEHLAAKYDDPRHPEHTARERAVVAYLQEYRDASAA